MKTAATLIISLVLAAPVLADDITLLGGGFGRHKSTVAVVGSDSTAYPRTVTQRVGHIGIAVSHAWNPQWSTEGAIEYSRNHMIGMRFVETGGPVGSVPFTSDEYVRTTPVDLAMRFHFVNDGRWKPYVSAGAHYVNSPDITVADLNGPPDSSGLIPVRVRRPDSRLSAAVGAGTKLMLTHRLGLRADVKRLLRHDELPYDPLWRRSFGVTWNF